MALQKFTDSAGREAFVDPATKKVYTEGGTKDTFYTLDQWNARQAKKYNQPVNSSSATNTSSSGSDYNSIFKNVTDQFAPGFNESVKGLADTAKSVLSGAKDISNSYKAQIPTVQNIYTQLAAELGKTFESETATKTQEKTDTINAQSEEAARGGFETNTGFEAAQKGVTEKKFDDMITTVADSYRINRDKLASEETKDIQTLLTEAATAMQNGNETVANISLNIAKLKQDQQTLIVQATTAIKNAVNAEEANKIQSDYNNAQVQLKQQELKLTADKIAADKDQKQVVMDKDGKLHIVNLSTEKETPLDITQNNKSETQLKEDARTDLRADIAAGKTNVQELSSAYPEFTTAEINTEIKDLKPSFFQNVGKFLGL